MTTLEEYCEDEDFLRKCLGPTVTSAACDTARSSHQDSLIRLLLQVPDMQPRLLTLLLERMAEIALNEDTPATATFHGSQKVNMTRLIISAVRWLPKIFRGAELSAKVIEILEATPTHAQMEVITAVPEIVDDQHHSEVALKLRDIYNMKPVLTPTILDAFTNLNLDQDLLSELRAAVMKTLGTVQLVNLPTVVKFLIDVIPKGEVGPIVQELRDNLDITPAKPATQRPGNIISTRSHAVVKFLTFSHFIFYLYVCHHFFSF